MNNKIKLMHDDIDAMISKITFPEFEDRISDRSSLFDDHLALNHAYNTGLYLNNIKHHWRWMREIHEALVEIHNYCDSSNNCSGDTEHCQENRCPGYLADQIDYLKDAHHHAN